MAVGEERRTYHWGGDQPADQRLTVAQAAAHLGITEVAVRNRIKRGTLRSEREAGRVYVLLAGPVNHGQPSGQPTGESLLVAVLREQLEVEREANRENRRIIAALTQRIPEIEAPSQEARESPESATEQPGRVEPQPAVGGAKEPRESHEMAMRETGGGPLPRDQQTPSARPWWRRMFGG